MREAILYKKLEKDDLVQCQACQHYCALKPGERGKCGVRENKNGKLYSLVYGKIAALNIDPIEKKPFFHFMPGTETFSFGTVGCNFSCKSCQNWELSQSPKITGKIQGDAMTPEMIIENAIRYQCPSISYTYNEPTVFLEFALETMKLAKKRGLRNLWVSNGFMSKETVDIISPYLDAINIDLKAFSEKDYQEYCGGRLKPVLNNIKTLKQRKIWVEITTLAIPRVINEKVFHQMAKFIKEEVGKETPWHISRFFPEISWRLRHLYATPLDLVQKGCDIGIAEGLLYVYGGNVPGLASEDTYCPKCHQKMIDRTGYIIERKDKNGKCSNCGTDLDIIE
ncbi:MAG TPA: AmmeMemoRadiSam system radical SAM enzyme [Candidatus Pacearchaeota archaeon]|nr:AmmeMemoRadiSam system radical SAM enzyme [Candidatus Pacearchaeota archaeon]HOK94308.1 AmmeMemoRadiSam system radical SAM enzyme [Candidatus Pacearchaeota archaeon]HPO75336.1 AmmeMemoRadiSam system radical SAM enzyme [Candidatus Pacearchaeota archaeon]